MLWWQCIPPNCLKLLSGGGGTVFNSLHHTRAPENLSLFWCVLWALVVASVHPIELCLTLCSCVVAHCLTLCSCVVWWHSAPHKSSGWRPIRRRGCTWKPVPPAAQQDWEEKTLLSILLTLPLQQCATLLGGLFLVNLRTTSMRKYNLILFRHLAQINTNYFHIALWQQTFLVFYGQYYWHCFLKVEN